MAITSARRNGWRALESLVADDKIGIDMRNWFARAETLVALADGADDDAWTAADIDRRSVLGSGLASPGAARAQTSRRRRWDVLAGAEPRCVRHDVILGLLRARSDADSAEALTLAADALTLASSNLMLQTVASECRDSMELVERVAWCVPEHRGWIVCDVAATHDCGPSPIASAHHAEQLTQRERDVLRFLPSRLTLREIAGELYVSVNTLKFHLRVIYRKLGVNSREEAATLARSMTSIRRRTASTLIGGDHPHASRTHEPDHSLCTFCFWRSNSSRDRSPLSSRSASASNCRTGSTSGWGHAAATCHRSNGGRVSRSGIRSREL